MRTPLHEAGTTTLARRTHKHACTPTYVYRDIHVHTFMHACMNLYIKASPPLCIITSITDKGENDIHSLNPDISIAPRSVHYYSEALPTTVIDSVGVYTTKCYRQPYTVHKVRHARGRGGPRRCDSF